MQNTFSARLFDLAISIPAGRVTTYGALARAAGGGGQAARSVSHILSKAPNPRVIPWHRIVYAGGKVFQSAEHDKLRNKLYKQEGIEVDKKTGRIKNFEEVLYDFE